ncbi:hypothetical protein PybrP1_009384 [[Pythium] brassicae (nom. inval.)]|nr:hypothetical protein PybrP1_009384 [[Pythium] brassicae (nom. inval.)]
MLASAKTLADITKITLAFFNEHELVQRSKLSAVGTVFPIIVPASDVYNMLVPRKRRIYDVLHVLEGVGIIKRVRHDDATGTKGGSFLYFGKEAAIRQLAKTRRTAIETVETLWQAALQVPSADEIDAVLVKMCEEQGEREKWPCLTTTTSAFLSILFRYDADQALALPDVSTRLLGSKKVRGFGLLSDSAHADVNRRVYDVVSVLASCDLVLVSVSPDGADEREDVPDKISARKHVQFNYAVFDDPSTFGIADVSADTLSRHLERERMLEPLSPKRRRRSRTPKARRTEGAEKSSAQRRLSLCTDERLAASSDWSNSGDAHATNANGWWFDAADPVANNDDATLLHNDLKAFPGFADVAMSMMKPVEALASQQLVQSVREELDLDSYCPIIKNEPEQSREWWDASLQDLLLQDALPPQDRLDWELMKEAPRVTATDGDESAWGESSSPVQLHRELLPHQGNEDIDLSCHEAFPGDESPSSRFFAFSWNRLSSPPQLDTVGYHSP